MNEKVVDTPSSDDFRRLIAEGSFESALGALEEVLAHLEHGRLSMDESVTWYEIGLGLTKRCSDLLQQAELRIRSIEDRFAVTVGVEPDWDADES